MSRPKSPNYPSLPLEEAIEFIRKIYSRSRSNPIDRQAAAKDMGYAGISGRSAQVLGTLAQYDLTERTGKEGLRVSPTAIDILHPDSEANRRSALRAAGFAPPLFSELRQRFSDGVPSDNAIRSYLMRKGYSDAAITPAVSSFLETCRYLQQENAFGEEEASAASNSMVENISNSDTARAELPALGKQVSLMPTPSPTSQLSSRITSERVIFTEESSPDQYIKIAISGELDIYLIEAVENFIDRQKKRLSSQNKL